MTIAENPVLARRRLANELRALRVQAGYTLVQVAEGLECSKSKVSRLETGRHPISPRDVRALCDIYAVHGEDRERLAALAYASTGGRMWWQGRFTQAVSRLDLDGTTMDTFLAFESEAIRLSRWEMTAICGLLQTTDYTRALLRSCMPGWLPNVQQEKAIEQATALRSSRSRILDREERRLHLIAILDEAVLRRMVGGPEVMAAQLQHLVVMAARPNVTIQVLPFSTGGHPGIDGSFSVLEFADMDPLVHLEQTMRATFVETRDETMAFMRRFAALSDVATSPDASIAFMNAMLRELPG